MPDQHDLRVTLHKAFLRDMRDLDTGYRVVSYRGLGVVLMAVSYACQKDCLVVREAFAEENAGAQS